MLADRHADSYFVVVFGMYVFILLPSGDYVLRALGFVTLAAVPMYLGEALAVLLIERKIGNKIMTTRYKGENILRMCYFFTIMGFGVIIVLYDRFRNMVR